MFARSYVELPFRFDDVERLLLERSGDWLPDLARKAEDRGAALLAELRAGRLGEPDLNEGHGEVRLGAPIRLTQKTLLPVSIEHLGGMQGFPPLEADLEVVALGAGGCQLAISARYRSPLAAHDDHLNRVQLLAVAEAALKNLLDHIVLRLREGIATDVR